MQKATSHGSLSFGDAKKPVINTRNNLKLLQNDDYEYVQAMQEDLCDWFNRLYQMKLTIDTFLPSLDNGVLLCRLASLVQSHGKSYFGRLNSQTEAMNNNNNNNNDGEKADERKVCKIKIGHNLVKLPDAPPAFHEDARNGTFFARDNISNFITWCKQFGVPPYFLFETNDLVLRKNVKNLLLCLLVIARIGSEFGVEVPELIKLEQEIDLEEAADDANSNSVVLPADLAEIDRLNAEMLKQQEIQRKLMNDDQEHKRMLDAQHLAILQQREKWLHDQEQLHKVLEEKESLRRIKLKNQRFVDMRTLDEVIRGMISDCSCDVPILMKKMAPGKYQFGEEKTMIFVRILRNHVMVRVGGGWDTFDSFLWKRDPCRRHRPKAELQQRAIELLQKNREIFYCEDLPLDQSSVGAGASFAANAGSDMSAAASRKISAPSTPRSALLQTQPLMQNASSATRIRVRAASVIGQPRLDFVDGSSSLNRNKIQAPVPIASPVQATAQAAALIRPIATNGSGVPIIAPKQRSKSTLLAPQFLAAMNGSEAKHAGLVLMPSNTIATLREDAETKNGAENGNDTNNLSLTNGFGHAHAHAQAQAQAQTRQDDLLQARRSEVALQKHMARFKKAQSTTEINSVGGAPNGTAPNAAQLRKSPLTIASPRTSLSQTLTQTQTQRSQTPTRGRKLSESTTKIATDDKAASRESTKLAGGASSVVQKSSVVASETNAVSTREPPVPKLNLAPPVPKLNLVPSAAANRRSMPAGSGAPSSARLSQTVVPRQTANSSSSSQSRPKLIPTRAALNAQVSRNGVTLIKKVADRASVGPVAVAATVAPNGAINATEFKVVETIEEINQSNSGSKSPSASDSSGEQSITSALNSNGTSQASHTAQHSPSTTTDSGAASEIAFATESVSTPPDLETKTMVAEQLNGAITETETLTQTQTQAKLIEMPVDLNGQAETKADQGQKPIVIMRKPAENAPRISKLQIPVAVSRSRLPIPQSSMPSKAANS